MTTSSRIVPSQYDLGDIAEASLSLILPILLPNGRLFYFLDANGNGGTYRYEDAINHDILDAIFNNGSDTTDDIDIISFGSDTARSQLIKAITIALPTIYDLYSLQQYGGYPDLLIFQQGWPSVNSYWSSTSYSRGYHLAAGLEGGSSYPIADGLPLLSGLEVVTADYISLAVPENELHVAKLTIVGANSVGDGVLSISGGPDAGAFVILPTTHELQFRRLSDFEDPDDYGRDNQYELEITFSTVDTTIRQLFKILVTDATEAPPPYPALLGPQVSRTSANFGFALALSGDGQTAVIGAPADDIGMWGSSGSASVYRWGQSNWTAQGDRLIPSGTHEIDTFGRAIALSSSGSVVLAGGTSPSGLGEVRAFEWTAGSWRARGDVLGGYNPTLAGESIALSWDGNIAIVGEPAFPLIGFPNSGGARVYAWTGEAWLQRGAPLVPSDAAPGDKFGTSVALSADGLVAVVGGPGDDRNFGGTPSNPGRIDDQGSARVFEWTGGNWQQRGTTLTPIDGLAGDLFGTSVAISADGLTVIVGGPGDDIDFRMGQGSARVFVWTGSTWQQRGAALSPADGLAGDAFGTSVGISADGLTAIVGGPGDDVIGKADQGSARVYRWNGSSWEQKGGMLTPLDGSAGDAFGSSVSISANGLVAMVGGPGVDVQGAVDQGSALVYVWNGTGWQAPSMLSFVVSLNSKSEGSSGVSILSFTVVRSGNLNQETSATWTLAGSGVFPAEAADFEGSQMPFGTITFMPGESIRTFDVPVVGDIEVEENEGFIVTLASASAGTSMGIDRAFGTILNDDARLAISATGANKPEGSGPSGTPFTFAVTRSGDLSKAHTATWTVAGATGSGTLPANAADFLGGVFPSGVVSFAAGETSKTVTVTVASDRMVELNERFSVTLSAPSSGAAIGTATAGAVIQNDDTAGTGTLSIARLQAARGEGQAGSTPFSFAVTRTGNLAGPTAVDWTVGKGTISGTTSTAASDFVGGVLPRGSVSFAAGETSKIVTVSIAGDAAVELNESFTITLSNLPSGVTMGTASATGLVLNDDTPGSGGLSIARLSAFRNEGNSATTPFTFSVTRSGDTSKGAGAGWAVTGGGATGTVAAAGPDFSGGALPVGFVSFAPGQTAQTVTVNVAGDAAAELNESFTVTLSGATPGVALTGPSATGVILNDDFASTAANQTLTGTDGPDVFLLGGGLDVIIGKGGVDAFRFQPAAVGTASTNTTTFNDFNRAAGEKLDLSAIDAIAGTAANDAFSFIGTAAFNGTPGQLRWEDQGTFRLIQGNVNNDMTADLTIRVNAAGPVEVGWFVV